MSWSSQHVIFPLDPSDDAHALHLASIGSGLVLEYTGDFRYGVGGFTHIHREASGVSSSNPFPGCRVKPVAQLTHLKG